MNRKIGAAVLVVVIVVVGIVAYALNNRPSSSSNNGTNTNSSASNANQAAAGTSFTINATDDSADVTTLNVKKGDTIKITFNVQQQGVYHGGLEFRSDGVSSGPIQPGQSKTVTFAADKSFTFTPYWYQSNVKKDYTISVNVQ